MISNIKIDFSLYAAQHIMAPGGGAYTTVEVIQLLHVCPPQKAAHTHHMTESNVTH